MSLWTRLYPVLSQRKLHDATVLIPSTQPNTMGLSVQTAGTENGTMEKQEHWKTLEQSRIKKAKQLA